MVYDLNDCDDFSGFEEIMIVYICLISLSWFVPVEERLLRFHFIHRSFPSSFNDPTPVTFIREVKSMSSQADDGSYVADDGFFVDVTTRYDEYAENSVGD